LDVFGSSRSRAETPVGTKAILLLAAILESAADETTNKIDPQSSLARIDQILGESSNI
jgi:hypothetical protein